MTLPVKTTTKEDLYNKFPEENEKDSVQSNSPEFVVVDNDSEEEAEQNPFGFMRRGFLSPNLGSIDPTDSDSSITSTLQADDTTIIHAKKSTTVSTKQDLVEANSKTAVNNPINQDMITEEEEVIKAIAKDVSAEKEGPSILESPDIEVEELSPPRYPATKDESGFNTGSSCNSNQKQQLKKRTAHEKNKDKVSSKPGIPITRSRGQASKINTSSTSDSKPEKQQGFSLKVNLFTEGIGYDFLSGGNKIGASVGFFSSLLKNNQMNPASVQYEPTMPYPAVNVEFQDTGKARRISINRLSVELDQATNTASFNQDIGRNNVIKVNASVFNNEVGNGSNKRLGKKTRDNTNKRVSPTRSVFESIDCFILSWVFPPILIVICFIIADYFINMINNRSL